MPLWKRCKEEIKPNSNRSVNSKINSINSGRLLWLQLTHVIFLTQQMRQANDPEYAAFISRLRNGTSNSETIDQDYKYLQSLMIKNNNMNDPIWNFAGVCVSRNELREKINKVQCDRFSDFHNTNVYMCKAEDNRTKSNKQISTELTPELNYRINELSEKKQINYQLCYH